MSKTIGIDLGTTNSCVSVVEGGRAVIIPNENGGATTPSVVAFSQNGERIIGAAAIRQAAVNSKRTVVSVKRHMGSDWSIGVDGHSYSAQEISAMILRRLKENAERYLGETVTDAVITVPAYFNDIQRQATKDAGRIAGLKVKRIINEPTSAALSYGLNNEAAQKIMVFDLGGGTFDVSVIEIGDGVIEVLATSGDNRLGGDDFDERIVKHLLSILKKEYKVDASRDLAALQRLTEAAENAKKELSSANNATINLPYLIKSGNDMVHFEYTLSRNEFNELTKDLVDRTAGPVQNALNDAGLAPSELSKVLLVGGSTRIPAVQDKVRSLTGIIPSKNINPDECVAQGAAIQGDILSESEKNELSSSTGLLLLDVTPMSLSIETIGGVATRLVERNSTLPIHYSQIFSTAAPFQRDVEIHVLQGERPMARDNKTIGKFRLTGIKRAPAGVPQIEVTFDIDTNGILTVSAKDLDTGKQQSIVITANDRMSEVEIEQAIMDAERYAAQDQIRREALEEINEANRVIARAEQAVESLGNNIEKEDKKRIKEECSALRKLIVKSKPENMTPVQVTAIKEARGRLETVSADACWRAEH